MTTGGAGIGSSVCDALDVAGMTPFIVFDAGARMVCLSARAQNLVSLVPGLQVGRHATELIGESIGRELASIITRVLSTGRPAVSMAMIRGFWIRGRYSPVAWGGHRWCVAASLPWTGTLGEDVGVEGAEQVFHRHHDLGDLGALTAREADVLRRLAQDKSVPEIAREISRSVKTVEAHIRALSAKTGRHGRLALAELPIERNLGRVDEEQIRLVFG